MAANVDADAVGRKRVREQEMVSEMIGLYCRAIHGRQQGGGLCASCTELEAYARQRSEHCPFMEEKTFCSVCPVHCYKPEMRMRIREVMRFAGPRMLWHHPVMAVRHMAETVRQKRMLKRGCDCGEPRALGESHARSEMTHRKRAEGKEADCER